MCVRPDFGENSEDRDMSRIFFIARHQRRGKKKKFYLISLLLKYVLDINELHLISRFCFVRHKDNLKILSGDPTHPYGFAQSTRKQMGARKYFLIVSMNVFAKLADNVVRKKGYGRKINPVKSFAVILRSTPEY